MKKITMILTIFLCFTNVCISIADTYEYDKVNRLTKVIYDDESTIEYSYDEYGNITNIIKKKIKTDNQAEKDNEQENKKDKEENQGQNQKDNQNDNQDQGQNNQDIKENIDDTKRQNQNTDSTDSSEGSSSYYEYGKQKQNKKQYISENEVEKSTENKPLKENIKFKDIKQNEWYSQSVNYIVDKKIMVGTSKDKFSPNENTTRAMITTILYRLTDTKFKPIYKKQFKDVSQDKWYTEGIIWAVQNNIVSGVTKDEFKPNDILTREQLVTILYNFEKTKQNTNQITTNMDKYKDKKEISNYALNAMNWAVANNIITGIQIDKLSPKTGVTRAQMAVILQRFIEKFNY